MPHRLNHLDRRLAIECLNAAAASRAMWMNMMRTGHGWTWAHYRGWLLDARRIRLGLKFEALGRGGVSANGFRRQMRRLSS